MWDQHREALTRGDKLSAGVWGAVFLEALLEELMRDRGIKRGARLELAGAIQALNGVQGDPILREITQTAEQIRLARNALVHPRTMVDAHIDMHADMIATMVQSILAQVCGILPERLASSSDIARQAPPLIGRVFVSSITPHSPLQQGFLEDVRDLLRAEGLEPVKVATTQFDRNDPVAPVLAAMRACDAVFCIGLSRAHAFLVRDKGKDEETHRHYTSGWMHMEVGMAYGLGLGIVTICESRIANDGAFDRNWNSSPPLVFSLDPPQIEDPHMIACIEQLKRLVSKRKAATLV